MTVIGALSKSAFSKSFDKNDGNAKISTEFSFGQPTKTTLDAGKGSDSIHIHTNFNGSVNVTVNGKCYHFSADQAQNLEIKGGAGNDCITSSGEACTSQPNITINGGKGNDLIFGGKGNETILGGRGNDVIFGGKGDDTIKGGRGNDAIFGGAGNDTIKGGRGHDILVGGRGDDTISGGRGKDTILGGKGDDTIKGGRGSDVILGGAGDDTIFGGRGNDIIFGGLGNDFIVGGHGCDSIFGGPGDDTIFADQVVKPKTSFDKASGGATWENANYTITANEKQSEMVVFNKNTGETYRIWGDPHVDVDGKRSFDFKEDAVFKLDDGTEIHIKTVEFNRNRSGLTLSSDVTILDGQSNSAVQWKNLDQNTLGDMEAQVTTECQISSCDLVSADNGIVIEEADGMKKGFEILNENSVLESLSGDAGANTKRVSQIEKSN